MPLSLPSINYKVLCLKRVTFKYWHIITVAIHVKETFNIKK